MSGVVGLPFGRYRLLERIGEGGMAQVWKGVLPGAHDFARTVVIKRILPALSENSDFNKMFTREALLSARLSHPNIVQVFEFSSVDDQLFLAMEYVDGVNLIDVLKAHRGKKKPIPLGFATYVVRDVCRALGYAHALRDESGVPLRLIHRDVTPSNIMISRDGVVKLLDFGIAKALNAASTDDRTRTGSLKGKLGYLSPEIVEGELELDQRADIFAAGIVLHELLTGRRLFKGSDDIRTLALVRACQVPLPSSMRDDVTPELDRICMKALERDREKRYVDAQSMAADLAEVAHLLSWDQPVAERFIESEHIEPSLPKQTAIEEEHTIPTSPDPVTLTPTSSRVPRYAVIFVAVAFVSSLGFLFVRRQHASELPPPPIVQSPATRGIDPPTIHDDPVMPTAAPSTVAATPKIARPPTKNVRRAARPRGIKDVGRGEIVNPF